MIVRVRFVVVAIIIPITISIVKVQVECAISIGRLGRAYLCGFDRSATLLTGTALLHLLLGTSIGFVSR